MSAAYRVDGKDIFHPCWCGSDRFVDNIFGQYKNCRVVRCVACGQLRTFPEPNPEALVEIYSPETAKYSEAGFDSGRDEEFAFFGNKVLAKVARHREGPGLLLDIGCNMGHQMRVARSVGWDAHGLEINQGVVPLLRKDGFTVYDTFLEEAPIPDNTYDLVIGNQILEHVPEPTRFLAAAARVLKPGGLLFLSLPCYWSPYPVLFKRDSWYALLPEEHIWQFSQSSLLRLIASSGLDLVEYRRECSQFGGRISANPRSWPRFLIHRFVAGAHLGDFHSVLCRKSS